MRCVDLEPDCALIGDADKGTGPVNGIREILSTSYLVLGGSQIAAAVESISTAAYSNIDGEETVLISNEDPSDY